MAGSLSLADIHNKEIGSFLSSNDCIEESTIAGRQRSEPRSPAVQGSAWELPGGVPLRYAPLEQTCS